MSVTAASVAGAQGRLLTAGLTDHYLNIKALNGTPLKDFTY